MTSVVVIIVQSPSRVFNCSLDWDTIFPFMENRSQWEDFVELGDRESTRIILI